MGLVEFARSPGRGEYHLLGRGLLCGRSSSGAGIAFMSRRNSNRKMDSSLRRAERLYLRALLAVLAGAILLVAGCWIGSRFYHRWQEHRFMRQAHVALEKGDLRWAALAAQRAMVAAPDSVDACRPLADIYDRQ